RAVVPTSEQEADQRDTENHDAFCYPTGTARIDRLEEGAWRINVTAFGYGVASSRVIVHAGASTTCEVKLGRAVATLGGRIRDHQGQPIASASVSLWTADGQVLSSEPHYSTTTGKDGRFLYSAVPPGLYLVNVNARGFALASFLLTAASSEPAFP